MFEFIRKGTGSIAAGILLVLLIFSFALWGIGDPLSTLSTSSVAEVGDRKVTPNEFARAFENDFLQLQQRAGDQLTKQLAAQIMGPQSITRMVEQIAYDVEVKNLGIRVPDKELRDYIYNIPTFQDGSGLFNRSFFDQFARNQGYSSKEFENLIRDDVARGYFVNAIMNNIIAPEITTDTLSKYASEHRVAEILSIPASTMTSIGEGTDEILKAYYDENNTRYMASEYRAVSYFEISANEFASAVEVSEQQALSSYEARIMEFTRDEERGFVQMLLDDQQAAGVAYAELEGGKSFEEVIVDKTGDSAKNATFEPQTLNDFADLYGEDAGAALFDLTEGGYTRPIESGFGVYIFKLNGTVQGSIDNYEDVKTAIINDLKQDQAIDKLFDIRNKIDDELAAGAPIAEITSLLNLELKKVSAVSIEGMTPNDTASMELPLIVEFLDNTFISDVGGALQLFEGIADKFYMLSVDNIIPSVLKDFEDVKEDVTSDWAQMRREDLASKLANKITEDYNLTENNEKTLANYQGLSAEQIVNEVTVGRANAENTVSADIHTSIFVQNISDTQMIPAANGDGYVVVRVKARTFNEDIDEAAITLTKDQIKTTYQNDIMAAFIVHLFEALPVVINNANVQATLDQIVTPLE